MTFFSKNWWRIFVGVFAPICTVSSLEGSIYDFSLPALDDKERPKALLLVNIASECGLKNQLYDLETLYQKYKDQGLLIVAVPSADFNQEPLDDIKAEEFCRVNYGVTFPIAKKTHVVGVKANPIYKWLATYRTPIWNFHKYLFDKDGYLVQHYWPTTSPQSSSLEDQIKTLLK